MKLTRIAIFYFSCALIFFQTNYCSTQELADLAQFPFYGEINSNGVNLRVDSTVASEIISSLNQEDIVEVILESYGWYKIRLPESAPAFIKKSLLEISEDKTAQVSKNRVNIRLSPNERSAILGKADRDQEIILLDEADKDWYKIKPVENTFGWVHKKFVDKITDDKKLKSIKKIKKKYEGEKEEQEKISPALGEDEITLTGIIKPRGRFFKQKAAHQLSADDNKIFLLKGNKETLDALNHRKVKITGKLITPNNQKYPIVEINKIIEQVE